jgi:hypothetical protein
MRVHLSFELAESDLQAVAFWGGHEGRPDRETVKAYIQDAVDGALSETLSKMYASQRTAKQEAGGASAVYHEDGKTILVTEPLGAGTMDKQMGVLNPSADAVERRDITWSDTNLDHVFPPGAVFDRLVCRNCAGIHFEVMGTGPYETSARCAACGMYYIVHCG